MSDPYAPLSHRRVVEMEDADALVERRLRTLGATDAEVAEFREAWGDAGDWARADDGTLIRAIAGARAVDPARMREVGVDDDAPGATVMGVIGPEAPDAADPNAPPVGTIDEVLEWVGDSRQRAVLALSRERSRVPPRKTLVTALRRVVASG